MKWARQWDADEGPVVILLRSVHLLAVVLAKVLFCQASVHLVEDQALGSSLRADQTNHEAPLDAEAQHALDIRTNHFEVHETGQAFLEEVGGDLIDVLSLVLKLLLELGKLAPFGLPRSSIVDEWLRHNAHLAQGFDYIVKLWLVNDRVVNLVVFAVFNAGLSEPRHNGKRHALLLVLLHGLYSLLSQELLRLKEQSMLVCLFIISIQNLLVLRIDLSHILPVLVELGILLFPALKFIHLDLVFILLFDNTALLFLASGSCLSLLVERRLGHLELLMVHQDLLELLLSMLADSLPLDSVHGLVVLVHQRWQLLLDCLNLLVVDDEEKVGEHL